MASWPMMCKRVRTFVLEWHWYGQSVTFRHIQYYRDGVLTVKMHVLIASLIQRLFNWDKVGRCVGLTVIICFCLTVIRSEGTCLISWQGFKRRIMPHIFAPVLSYLQSLTCIGWRKYMRMVHANITILMVGGLGGGKREECFGTYRTGKLIWSDTVLMWCTLKRTFSIIYLIQWCVFKREPKIILVHVENCKASALEVCCIQWGTKSQWHRILWMINGFILCLTGWKC